MAIDISKIDNLLIDEGTADDPFILSDRETTTLYKLAVSNNPKVSIKGYINTVSGTILKYQSYQIKKAWPDLVVLAREVASQDWTVRLLSSSIIEGGETRLIATNIALDTLEFSVRSVSCDRRNPDEIVPLVHFDKSTGIVSFDRPTSNIGWTATIILEFWPSYIEVPAPEDYRTVQLTVRAIAVDNVNIIAPSRIDESSITSIVLEPSPLSNTKGDNIKFSLASTYGTISPVGRTELSTFTYFAPTFAEIVAAGGTVPTDSTGNKYFDHEFLAAYYMFDVTEASGTNDTIVRMQNKDFTVTCDKNSLIEGEKAEFTVDGYEWQECQKTIVVDAAKLHDITEEELRRRIVFENGPFFAMYAPIDNLTYSADIKIYIAPPGAPATGDRAFEFDMHLSAVGISTVTLNPQTLGQGIPSVVTIEYRPLVHTKGTLSFGLTCSALDFQSIDDEHGQYKILSYTISTTGHDAIASVYSEEIGRQTPLISALRKIYVQNPRFHIGFNPELTIQSAELPESEEIQCYTDNILHLSELNKNISVNIIEGADLITEQQIIDRLNFSDDISTDKIWFDNPKENISWRAIVSIVLSAKYFPEGTTPSYTQTLTLTCEAIEVNGIEWQDNGNNYRVATTPFTPAAMVGKYFAMKTLPANNTKKASLEAVFPTAQNSPFSIAEPGEGLTLNPVGNRPYGTYISIANRHGDWYVHGYLAAFANNTEYSKVTKNLSGKSTQNTTPSTNNIVYPKNLTLCTIQNTDKIELAKLNDTYLDFYDCVSSGSPIDHPIITRKVGKTTLSAATIVTVANYNTESVCFSTTIEDKTDAAGFNVVMCSHFMATSTDITASGNTDVDTIINYEEDQKIYIRISLETIGITNPATENIEAAINSYILAQYNANTPITIWYPLAVDTTTTYDDQLYYDNIFFEAPTYHIYSANNPDNQCSIEFINNATVATETLDASSRIIFGQSYAVSSSNNKIIETLSIRPVRADTDGSDYIKFFSGTPTSIDQYDEDGNLLLDTNGNPEKGEVNIWENFSGKYEEWTDNAPAQITWDILGNTDFIQPSYDPDTNTITCATLNSISVYNDDQLSDTTTFMGYNFPNKGIIRDRYDAESHSRVKQIDTLVFTGTESMSVYQIRDTVASVVWTMPSNISSGSYIADLLSTHFTTLTGWHLNNADWPITICLIGRNAYAQLPHALLGTNSSSTGAEIVAAFRAYFAAQYEAGTPVTFYYPITDAVVTGDKYYYDIGNVHHKYTISKLINEDGTEYDENGEISVPNTFNTAFVFNKDGTIPSRFFLPRFMPCWNQNDNTSIISLAKGLSPQQRTITREKVLEKGCYYKDSDGTLKQIDTLYYGPLLAYTWLSYFTYGSINLKEAIGLGASKTSAEGAIFADDSGTPLTPGVDYASVWVVQNGLLDDLTAAQKYDFNILGVSDAKDIATEPTSSYKVKSITHSNGYSCIELGKLQSGSIVATSYTAKTAVDYYSLNSCFSPTGYSEDNYLDIDSEAVISGYGQSTVYNDNRHPVRCLNVENMWGGGDYIIDGTGFTIDEEDNSIVHPILWNPTETSTQDITDINTWETDTTLNVLQQAGTWDIGSFKYKGARCAWPDIPANKRIPDRGYNVYNRPITLQNAKYRWITGNYNDWTASSDYPRMCGLGHTHIIMDNQYNTTITDGADTYQVVEYIENTGTAYIDTGVKYGKFVHDIQFTASSGRMLMGHWSSNPYWGKNASNKYELCGSGAGSTSALDRNEVAYYIWSTGGGGLDVNGVKAATYSATYTNTYTYQLLALNGGFNCRAKVYRLTIYSETGSVISEMLPCYRLSDDKVGMYDVVRHAFYTCPTSATFSHGSNATSIPEGLNDERYFKINNLIIKNDNSDNKVAINTDLKLAQNIKFICDFESAHSSTTNSYFGGCENISHVTGLNLYVSSDNRLCCNNSGTVINLSGEDTILPNTRHTIEVEQINDRLIAKLDGIQTYSGPNILLDTTFTYYLFAVNEYGVINYNKAFKGKVYSVEIYKNNKLAKDYIPVYDTLDAVFGLYNTIDTKIKPISALIPEENKALQAIDCILFKPGQYIDTDWTYTSGSKIKLTAKKPIAGLSRIFGNDETNNTLLIELSDSVNKPAVEIGSMGIKELSTTSTVDKIYTLELTASDSDFNFLVKGNNIASLAISDEVGINTQTNSCFLGGYRGSDGLIGASTLNNQIYDCIIYENNGEDYIPVKHFVPVYNYITQTYGMHEIISDTFYANAGSGDLSTVNGAVQLVEYVENTNNASYANWSIDTEIKFKDTGKIVADLSIMTAASDGHNKCINGSLSSNAAGTTYLSYSDNTVGGVTLISRTIEGTTATWRYTYNNTDNATVHISAGGTATDSGRLRFKRVTIYATDGVTVIRNLVAAADGFYDTVSGQYLQNQGTSKTTNGPAIDAGVPGDPGTLFEKIKLLARVYGTLS